MTVGRGASILSPPSPSVILREPHGLPHTAMSESGDHFLSKGLSRVLSITKMWGNGRDPDGRGKMGNGLGAFCPNKDYCKDIGTSYGLTRCHKIDG